MVETASRVAFVSFAVMMCAFLVLKLLINPVKNLLLVLSISILIVYFIFPYFLSQDILVNRIWASLNGDYAKRDDIWISYFPAIWNSIVFGYGFSGYEEKSMDIFGKIMSPHNVVIEVLLYGGIIALIFFILFNIQVFSNSIRMYLYKKE